MLFRICDTFTMNFPLLYTQIQPLQKAFTPLHAFTSITLPNVVVFLVLSLLILCSLVFHAFGALKMEPQQPSFFFEATLSLFFGKCKMWSLFVWLSSFIWASGVPMAQWDSPHLFFSFPGPQLFSNVGFSNLGCWKAYNWARHLELHVQASKTPIWALYKSNSP